MSVTVGFQGAKLANPIDDAGSHGRPLSAVSILSLRGVFTVTVADPVFGKQGIAIGIGLLTARSSIARVPIEHHLGRIDLCKNLRPFGASHSVGCKLIVPNHN